MKSQLDMDKIAKALGATRRGKVRASGGYFGALQLYADVQQKFRTPKGGGRPTDPAWTERRLVGLSTETLRRLQDIATRISKTKGVHLNAMQVAAILIERALLAIDDGMDLIGSSAGNFDSNRAVGDRE